MNQSIRIYASNLFLAREVMEAAFSLMRNEGRSRAEIMATVYESLTAGIDVSNADRAAVHDVMKGIIKNIPENDSFRESTERRGQ